LIPARIRDLVNNIVGPVPPWDLGPDLSRNNQRPDRPAPPGDATLGREQRAWLSIRIAGTEDTMDTRSRRRHRRYDVKDVSGNFVVRIDVDVINLSVAGMAIETQRTLIVGRRYLFSIGEQGRHVEVSGRVIWCALGKTRRIGRQITPIFRAGIQFEDVLSDDTLELQKLIERSAVLDPETQIFGRFVSEIGGIIDVEAEASFEVKKISLSGMLIDTDWAPSKDEVIRFDARLGDFEFCGHGRVAYIEGYEDHQGASRFRLGVEFSLLSDVARSGLNDYLNAILAADHCEETA
jgi:hypothetical protein